VESHLELTNYDDSVNEDHTLLPSPPASFTSSPTLHSPFTLNMVWERPSIKVFQNWGVFTALAIPGALSLFLEWGSFELMAGLAGHLGDTALATHGIYMTTCGLFYMIPLSIADGTATLAGNYLGENKPSQARSVILLGVVLSCSWGMISAAALMFLLRPVWGTIFTTDAGVINSVYHFMPVMFVYIFVDATKCIALNILRSTGRPGITAWGNILACLFIMLPFGWLFGLHYKYNLFGLWGAMSAAWLAATILYMTQIYFTDWHEQCALASNRINSNKNEE
jgi:Na+-driven multidrug efflux pump